MLAIVKVSVYNRSAAAAAPITPKVEKPAAEPALAADVLLGRAEVVPLDSVQESLVIE